MSRYLNDRLVDDNGLSSDSMRGSAQHIAVHLVGGTNRDPNNTNNVLTRDPLSAAEREVLRQNGTFVDENGNGIDDREEIAAMAPPGFFLPQVQTSPMFNGQPNGYWAQRGSEWVWFGERPPSMAATPSAGQGGGHAADQDPARAFAAHQAQTQAPRPAPTSDIAEHVVKHTPGFLPPHDAYAPPELLASAPEPGANLPPPISYGTTTPHVDADVPPPPFAGRPDISPPLVAEVETPEASVARHQTPTPTPPTPAVLPMDTPSDTPSDDVGRPDKGANDD